jgi:hypothetical protein
MVYLFLVLIDYFENGIFCIGVCVVQMYSLLLCSIYVVAFKCIPKDIVVFYLNYVYLNLCGWSGA